MFTPRLAVFDMDGTLLDSVPDLAACSRELLEICHLPPLTDAEVRTMIGNGVPTLVQRVLDAGHKKLKAITSQPYVLPFTKAEAVQKFMELYTPRATRLSRLFPGTQQALEQLKSAGWLLAVCTNKPEVAAQRILDNFGLTSLFAAIGGGDSFAAHKPDPAHLLGTIKQAGGEVSRSVMIGDMPPDCGAATGAGVRFVFAAWGYGSSALAAQADAQAGSMMDIPSVLPALLPA
ncbi:MULTISPECIES: HAD hydrolase-like protein [Acetobacter]|uniref:phosphoglycolate phosphatase n=2 Tax=Acetobacter TaxID=434 RepID=A0AAN1PH97_9PROT|nr:MULTISPECIES: HAD hydrolase-like protein [Acetobacter]ASL40534.1 phosphoglycolate phosphatase [Acetobacter oryzifermentans]AXN00125.1 phosphoglycolate phosphatase [Acetobacter pomorum]KAA8384798.1 HAD family hydrolase [Acetobacter sp. DmW_136]KAA8399978.1 HAD family hydrolase [Acetobacter sp. DmW_125124]KAA8400543.1 HAD family hydrolase [Acetobacter sp. DmW_125128]